MSVIQSGRRQVPNRQDIHDGKVREMIAMISAA